jgi:hypothetical protein
MSSAARLHHRGGAAGRSQPSLGSGACQEQRHGRLAVIASAKERSLLCARQRIEIGPASVSSDCHGESPFTGTSAGRPQQNIMHLI